MSRISDNTRGALLMMASMAAFTLNDASMKALSDELPLFQALFLRGVGTVVLMALLAMAQGAFRASVSRRDWGVIALRSLAEVGAAYFFLTALFNMPIANVTAVLQALPLTITLAGALFLGEPVGWRRLLAICAGFIGVLMIVRPGPEGFNTYAIYALVAVGFVTLRDLAARRLSPETPSMLAALSAAAAVTVFSLFLSVFEPWAPVSPKAALQLSAAAVFVIAGYAFSVVVMRRGDISFVAPFRYTGLLWALLLGLVIFGEWPDTLTLIGSGIVVATGLFSFYRERRRAVRARRAATQASRSGTTC